MKAEVVHCFNGHYFGKVCMHRLVKMPMNNLSTKNFKLVVEYLSDKDALGQDIWLPISKDDREDDHVTAMKLAIYNLKSKSNDT